MSYCCVAYIENGRKTMSTVPSNWLKDGIMRWPRQISIQRSCYKNRTEPQDNWYRIEEYDVLKEGTLFVTRFFL